MEIKTLEIAGFYSALKALHLPFSKGSQVDLSGDIIPRAMPDDGCIVCDWYELEFPLSDIHLMNALMRQGDEHAKVLRGINVWAEITAPVYWWAELETYRAGHERLSSQSTMHTDCKGLSGEELQKAKSEIPMGKELKKIDMFSYQTLRRIYIQRKNHRLPEWHTFVDWVRTLPFAEELILVGLEDRKEIEEKAKRFDMIKDVLENAESVNHFTELIKSMFTKEE